MLERSKFPIPKLPTSTSNSLLDSVKHFERMIFPYTPKEFMTSIWEQKAVIIKRKKENYYGDLFSTKQLADILERNPIRFGVNLDVTSWTKTEGRQTHNLPGRANPAQVWDFYNNGCSIRMLNPQTFSTTIYEQCTNLQEFFGCFVGSNVYLTPPATQGFAPHYDDVEVFMLQVEGRKRWKIYKPSSVKDDIELPRVSSRNFKQTEVKGEPEIYEILEPGDLLYVPRGWVHQGEALAGEHSLHVTISTYQKNSWGDLLEKVMPNALELAMKEDVDFRRGLPVDYKLYMGLQNSDRSDIEEERAHFMNTVGSLMSRLIDYCEIDKDVDQFAVQDLHRCLPPKLSKDEINKTVKGTNNDTVL